VVAHGGGELVRQRWYVRVVSLLTQVFGAPQVRVVVVLRATASAGKK
jgi:hypothetical protein